MAYGLVQISAPAVEPVTVDEAAAFLRLDGTEENSLLASLIKAARQYCETFTQRQFVTATWKMTREAFPNVNEVLPKRQICVPKSPLQSVSSVTYIDSAGSIQTWGSGNYVVDTTAEPATITPAYGVAWPVARTQPSSVAVTFVSGYGLADSVPDGLKSAIKFLVAHWFENREAVSPQSMTPVPMAVESLLCAYKVGTYA